MSDMNDNVALITGASSGIGRATAEAFAARGAKVVLAARREDELAALMSEIEGRGGSATFVVTDVAIAQDVERMVAHTIKTFGRLDYAVNNAGIEGMFAGITDLPEREWDRVLDTNLKGTFLCLQYEARAMLAGGHGGAIVNVGSVNSFLGFPTGSAYVASKHGQIGLTTSVSAELAPQGIRVNLVCPGFIDTPMHHRGRELLGNAIYDNLLAQRVHTRRAGRPDEIAQTIVFLCSDAASYITGTTLTPDGGFTLTI
jgi:NAD(P)-dependent dehydrogenase (short-subunit alcohol dehydrogenase family)